MYTTETEAVVVGAGVIGISIARTLAKNGIETILIDKNKYVGEEVSARNSELFMLDFITLKIFKSKILQ